MKLTTLLLMPLIENKYAVLIDSFIENKVGIDPSFISKSLAKGLCANILQLQKNGMLAKAGIGNDKLKDEKQNTRSDSIFWIDNNSDNRYEREFFQLIDILIYYLNSTCYTGINGYEFHYAVYEQGSFYKKHKDQFRNDNNRKFSLISYFNENWLESDGGQLLIYQDTAIQKINPESQKAVFFRSNEMEHEVTIAHRSRMSITGWLKQV